MHVMLGVLYVEISVHGHMTVASCIEWVEHSLEFHYLNTLIRINSKRKYSGLSGSHFWQRSRLISTESMNKYMFLLYSANRTYPFSKRIIHSNVTAAMHVQLARGCLTPYQKSSLSGFFEILFCLSLSSTFAKISK